MMRGLVMKKSMDEFTLKERNALLGVWKVRFDENRNRHKGLEWASVLARLEIDDTGLRALFEMERTGGAPDVIGIDKRTGAIVFCDCSAESPSGRRSLCYDDAALRSRKEHKPKGSALGMAAAMGIELLNEEDYRRLQEFGTFDLKTSSWIQTPPAIRERGGALFCDRRYDAVFVYHNGADSYYGSRGFRGSLRV
jgi:hypothetical protein